MKSGSNNLKKTLHLSLLLAVVAVICQIGFCSELPEQTTPMAGVLLGGTVDSIRSSVELEALGRFAVQEHNKKENTLLEFTKVVKARETLVAGMILHLTLEANDGGKNKIYEAEVWERSWLNWKQLEEFKEVHDGQ